MPSFVRFPVRATGALVAVMGLAASAHALTAPVLSSADIHLTITSATACEATMSLSVDDGGADPAPPPEVEHRIEAFDGIRIDLVSLHGAEQVGDVRTIGHTRSLVVRPGLQAYQVRYRVEQPPGRRERCPLWVPTIPTDGQSRSVQIEVTLPAGAQPGSAMPRLAWTGTRGSVTLGHVPAFVRVPFSLEGERRPWDIATLMDALVVAIFIASTGVWLWWTRRS